MTTMSRVKIPFSGGCACGAIRYECSAEPVMMFKCHRRNYQQMTGSGFAPAVLVPAEAFRVTRGQMHYHFTRQRGWRPAQTRLLRRCALY